MRTKRQITTTAAAATVAAFGVLGTAVASADTESAAFGQAQQVTDGTAVSAYTIEELEPSDDTVGIEVTGQLYEADATVQAVEGTATPAIPSFTARTADGTDYQVLTQVTGPESLTVAPVAQGTESSGKIYFDVTGAAPTEVVYTDAAQNSVVWSEVSTAEEPTLEEPELTGEQ